MGKEPLLGTLLVIPWHMSLQTSLKTYCQFKNKVVLTSPVQNNRVLQRIYSLKYAMSHCKA